jgi:hypothetical protein
MRPITVPVDGKTPTVFLPPIDTFESTADEWIFDAII